MITHTDACVCGSILANLPAHVYVVDLAQRKVIYSNHSLRWALGYPATISDDDVLEEMLHPEDRQRYRDVFMGSDAVPEDAVVDLEARMRAVDGSWRWFASRVRVFKRDETGMPVEVLGVAADVTTSKLVVQQIQYEAHHDHLTDLLNRKQFTGSMERLIASGKIPATLCMCDIDYFKGINDSYGHLAGDRVLQAFAEILKRTLRHDDVIARLGGDEFGILFPGVAVEQCAPPMERVREQLAGTRFPLPSGEVFSVTVSVGLAQFDGTWDEQIWMESADRALYDAKRRGRNQSSRAPR